MTQTNNGTEVTGTAKLFVEMGPLAAFLVGYFMSDKIGPILDQALNTQMFGSGRGVFVATALFMPAWAIASAYSIWKERRVPPMLILMGVLVIGFGSLTLIFQNKIFYYMKSTFAYLLFASILGGGLLIRRNFLQMVMGSAIHMADEAWRTLTWRFFWLYIALAAGNEVLWRTMTPGCPPEGKCAAEALYVNIETFGFMVLIFLFIFAQAPFIMKHAKELPDAGDGTKASEKTSLKAENTPPEQPQDAENQP